MSRYADRLDEPTSGTLAREVVERLTPRQREEMREWLRARDEATTGDGRDNKH